MNKSDFRNLLLIDDDPSMRHMLRMVLEQQNYRVTEAENGVLALELMGKENFDSILCDVRMPEMDGLTFLQQDRVRQANATVIMMSAYGSIETAIECLKQGAYDYVSKPFKPDEVLLTLCKAEERQLLQRENLQLKQQLEQGGESFSIEQIIHESLEMEAVLDQVRKVAGSDASVLVTGETGTGKELVAKALHSESTRSKGPFLAINCSSIPAGLLESELFGHLKGAFTGADRTKQGLFAAAEDGTLFLDEIVELPLELQPKLLRVLQEGTIRPVGATSDQPINTRVIAACGQDLAQAVADGTFRNDLYYRLAVIELAIPPLRDRSEDIITLARHFLQQVAFREKQPVPALTEEACQSLLNYFWPGNVRELQNYIEKAMIFSKAGELTLPPLPPDRRKYPRTMEGDFSLKKAMGRMERKYIRKALDKTEGNRTQAAKLLEISLRALMYKIKEYEIE